ncbi:hypothetical protein BT96DRAFT_825800, partial [Gymnopus androsaceus JB14]
RYAMKCWGQDTVDAASQMKNLAQAKVIIKKHGKSKLGRLTSAFQRLASLFDIVLGHYISNHLFAGRAEIVQWMSENLWPFAVVKD